MMHRSNKVLYEKLTIIYIPFVLSLVGLILGYTFLHWLLLIRLQLFEVNEFAVLFVGPLVFSLLLVFFLLRKRLKLLVLKHREKEVYIFLLVCMLCVPTWMAQDYLILAAGKLTCVESVRDIKESTNRTKYYEVDRYYVDKSKIGLHSEFSSRGRHNKRFYMDIYIVIPIFEYEADSKSGNPQIWLGQKYSEDVSDRQSEARKETHYKAFLAKILADFDNYVPAFQYLDRLGNSDEKQKYILALRNSPIQEITDLIFVPVNAPFDDRLGNKLYWIIGISLAAMFLFLIMILVPNAKSK